MIEKIQENGGKTLSDDSLNYLSNILKEIFDKVITESEEKIINEKCSLQSKDIDKIIYDLFDLEENKFTYSERIKNEINNKNKIEFNTLGNNLQKRFYDK